MAICNRFVSHSAQQTEEMQNKTIPNRKFRIIDIGYSNKEAMQFRFNVKFKSGDWNLWEGKI